MKSVRMLLVMVLVVGAGQLVNSQEPSAPGKEDQLKRNKLHIAVQKICPISGDKLGEHGPPIKVTVGKSKEEVFLCSALSEAQLSLSSQL